MKVVKTERIVKTYYDALEEGKVLGRKCPACGHIEFPPYLACNECGNLDTEWVDLTNTRAHIKQMMRPLNIFPEREFKAKHGGYVPIAVQIDNADPVNTSLIHVDGDRWDELHDNLENIIVKPCIVQDEDTKICLWVLEDWEPSEEDLAPVEEAAPAAEAPVAAPAGGAGLSAELTKVVIECAAEAYGIDASEIKTTTDVREDLGNQSMKMIVMLSEITERVGISIDITEAGEFNTIGDFIKAVQDKSEPGTYTDLVVEAAEEAGSCAACEACAEDELDEIAKVVIASAAEAYGIDEAEIKLSTDVREDLGNQSMKMIVMLSEITERIGVSIDITEAGAMNTIGDFVKAVRERAGK